MIGRVRRRPRAPPSLGDFVRCCSDISCRRSCAPPSLGDFVRWCSDIPSRRSRAPPSFRDFVRCRPDISCRRSRAPHSLRDFVRWRSDISRRRSCLPPSLGDFVRWRSDISRRLRRGGANRKKKISVQVNLTLIFFFGLRREGDSILVISLFQFIHYQILKISKNHIFGYF